MKWIDYANSVNDLKENQDTVKKLPTYAINRWNRRQTSESVATMILS